MWLQNRLVCGVKSATNATRTTEREPVPLAGGWNDGQGEYFPL